MEMWQGSLSAYHPADFSIGITPIGVWNPMPIRPPSSRSAELSWASLSYVAAHETIRCRRDYMVVEPLDVDHGTLLAVIRQTKPLRGIVKAVGPGCYPKRYDHPDKHRRTKVWDSRTFQPTEVKPGDVIELGGYDFGGYAFQTFLWGDKVHLICREGDVSGVVVNGLSARSEMDQTD